MISPLYESFVNRINSCMVNESFSTSISWSLQKASRPALQLPVSM
nr:MAG TPA: hypothetical protein [Bacteriophage sp.]